MINFADVAKNTKEHNSNQLQIPDHLYRMKIIEALYLEN